MLSEADLKAAVQDGIKGAECCTVFCTYGSEIKDGGYELFHNSISGHQTDVPRIHATKTLGLSREQLADRVKAWVTSLHDTKAPRVDLNAALVETRGPAATGWPWSPDHFGHVLEGA